MHHRIWIPGAAVALAFAAAPVAQAATLRGTVVHSNARAHSYVVAAGSGKLSAVHAGHSPRLGSRVSMRVTALRNGTFSASHVRVRGRAHRARVRGTVTFVDRTHRSFVLSARGVSMLVRMKARGAHAANDTMPAMGDDVTVTASLDECTSDELVTDESTVSRTPGSQSSAIEIEGQILAIDPSARTLTVSADDDNASGQSIRVILPAAFDLSAFRVGDEIELAATPNPDGTFTAVASAGDDNEQDAQDINDNQGDGAQFGDHHGEGGDGQGDNGGGD